MIFIADFEHDLSIKKTAGEYLDQISFLIACKLMTLKYISVAQCVLKNDSSIVPEYAQFIVSMLNLWWHAQFMVSKLNLW